MGVEKGTKAGRIKYIYIFKRFYLKKRKISVNLIEESIIYILLLYVYIDI